MVQQEGVLLQQLAHQLQRITPCMSKCASDMRSSQYVYQMLSEEPRLMLQGSAGPVCGLDEHAMASKGC